MFISPLLQRVDVLSRYHERSLKCSNLCTCLFLKTLSWLRNLTLQLTNNMMKLLLRWYTWPAHQEVRLELAGNFLGSGVKAAISWKCLHTAVARPPDFLTDVSWRFILGVRILHLAVCADGIYAAHGRSFDPVLQVCHVWSEWTILFRKYFLQKERLI
jgi:hypothetical protein